MATIAGRLGTMPPLQMLQFLIVRKTGILRMWAEDGSISGSLYIQKGEVIHAECGSLSGPDAAMELLGIDENGSYRFDKDAVLCERTINSNAEYLVTEASRILDTKRRVNGIFPDPHAVPYSLVKDPSNCKGAKLHEEQQPVAKAITGDRDFTEITANTGAKQHEVMQAVATLLEANVIGIVAPLAKGRAVKRAFKLFQNKDILLPQELESRWRSMPPYTNIPLHCLWLVKNPKERILLQNIKFDPTMPAGEFAFPESRLKELGLKAGDEIWLKPSIS